MQNNKRVETSKQATNKTVQSAHWQAPIDQPDHSTEIMKIYKELWSI